MLLITIDIYADDPGRGAPVLLFAALVLAGYVVLALAPKVLRGAGVTMILIGVPAALGWWILPKADTFADVRPFLLLTILGMALCWLAPLSRGRVVFVAVLLVVVWLWLLGEVGGNDAYSAAPVPSPPAHTMFSVTAFTSGRASVQLDDLDPNDPLYPLAEQCDGGDMRSCDILYREAPLGSDFRDFGASCGNTFAGEAGSCADSESLLTPPTFSPVPVPVPTPRVGLTSSNDKSFEIGMVSLLVGVAFLFGLFGFDRRGYRAFATAFVVPAGLALFTGTGSLGNAAHHAWVGGLLTFFAGLLFGAVGHMTRRRFTAWGGGVAAAIGVVTIALDVAHVSNSTSSENVKLAGPGLIVIAFGAGLVVVAYGIALILDGRVGGRGRGAVAGGSGAPAPAPVGAVAGPPRPESPPLWPPAPPTLPAPPPSPPAP